MCIETIAYPHVTSTVFLTELFECLLLLGVCTPECIRYSCMVTLCTELLSALVALVPLYPILSTLLFGLA
jgi:hypothetical protein